MYRLGVLQICRYFTNIYMYSLKTVHNTAIGIQGKKIEVNKDVGPRICENKQKKLERIQQLSLVQFCVEKDD